MPFPQRIIEPVRVTRHTILVAKDPNTDSVVPNLLNDATNGTLANIVRQLSILSQQAGDLFDGLTHEAHSINVRVNSLQIRIDGLSVYLKQLDCTDGKAPFKNARRVYKRAVDFDQQIFSRVTMPDQLLEMYSRCDEPPQLYKLDPYRDDGKDCMKLYTDPSFFFNLWRSNTLKDSEKILQNREEKHHQRLKSRDNSSRYKLVIRQPYSSRILQKKLSSQCKELKTTQVNSNISHIGTSDQACKYPGEYMMKLNLSCIITNQQKALIPNTIEILQSFSPMIYGLIQKPHSKINNFDSNDDDYASPNCTNTSYNGYNVYKNQTQQFVNHYVESLVPLDKQKLEDEIRPPQTPTVPNSRIRTASSSSTSNSSSYLNSNPEKLSAPPPSPIKKKLHSKKRLPAPPPPPFISPQLPSPIIPPPPPPPAMPDPPATLVNGDIKSPSKQSLSSIHVTNTGNYIESSLRKTTGPNNFTYSDPYSDLLKSIRNGVELKKVENNKPEDVYSMANNTLNDVASILARRKYIEMSDSDSDSDIPPSSDSGWSKKCRKTRSKSVSSANFSTISNKGRSLSSSRETLSFPSPPPTVSLTDLNFSKPLPPSSSPPESPSPHSSLENFPPPPPLSPLLDCSLTDNEYEYIVSQPHQE